MTNEVDPKEGLFEHTQFSGLRTNVDDEGYGPGDLRVATNCDIDDGLELTRRRGYTAPVVANVDRSLWSWGAVCLGVGSNALRQIYPDFTTVTLRTGLTPDRELSYVTIADRVYYSNGVENGVVKNGQHRTWGLARPPAFSVAAAGGDLLAGKYQVAMTYLRNDGQESGSGRAVAIELLMVGGIQLSGLIASSDPTVTQKAIYATSVGGETLYRVGTIDNATTTFLIQKLQKDTSPLLTQFMQAPPAGSFIAESRGRMLVAVENRLYPSEAYSPELFDLRRGIPFADRITMIAPINDGKMFRMHGVWIGTNSKIIWLQGDTPEKWDFQVKANYGVIPGTLAYGDGELLGDGTAKGSLVPFFATNLGGFRVGKQGGELHNMMEGRFVYPPMDYGAGIVRRHRGMGQYLITLKGVQGIASVEV